MKQEDKELLFRDLCGRLPYKTTFNKTAFNKFIQKMQSFKFRLTSCEINSFGQYVINRNFSIKDVKPYLRPMPSMTEEEKKSFRRWQLNHENNTFDWLNAHHFDYRGLIEKGLALEAPKDMYGKEAEK